MGRTDRKQGAKPKKKPIESYDHKDKKLANNPPVGLLTPEADPDKGRKAKYQFVERLDPCEPFDSPYRETVTEASAAHFALEAEAVAGERDDELDLGTFEINS